MNMNLISLLIVSGLSLQVSAERNSDRGSRSWGGQSASATPRSEPAAPARSAPAPMSIPSAPQSTRSFSAPERTYTPSQTFRSAPVTRQPESAPAPTPQRETTQRFSETPRSERTFTQTVTQPQPVVQPARPVTPPPSTVQSTPERTSRTASTRNHEWGRETPDVANVPATRNQPAATRGEATAPVTIRFPSSRGEQEQASRTPSTRNPRSHEVPDVKTAPPTTARPLTPAAPEQRIAAPTRAPRTFRREEPNTVQITPPRTESRVTEKSSSPFSFSDRSRSSRERLEVGSRTPSTPTTPLNQAQHQATSLRSPQHWDSRTYGNEHNRPAYSSHSKPAPYAPPKHQSSYYSHHYPSHSGHYYHNSHGYHYSEGAFWTAFGLTLGASIFAPVYMGPVYTSTSYTTAWHGGAVTVSVGGPAYPYYRPFYRPYYCNTGYIHDGWYHSSAYYGGWRGNWYGGFSYMFNPMPVYRSYYLYEEPQTIVIEQPAPQVVYVNQPAPQVVYVDQPAQQAVEHVQQAPAMPARETPQLQAALPSVTAEAQSAQAQENAPCFCACKCNGRIACICEFACGSEFAYSPEDYTLSGFASYAESLNAELIWSSYAGLDRPEATDIVAGAGD
jgi:hypothetical protein